MFFLDLRTWKFWAFWYFILIILFSILYFFFSRDFYFSTSRYELTTSSLKEEIRVQLTNEINQSSTGRFFIERPILVGQSDIESIEFSESDKKYNLRLIMNLITSDGSIVMPLDLYLSIPYDKNYCGRINTKLEKFIEFRNIADPVDFTLWPGYTREKMEYSLRSIFSESNKQFYIAVSQSTCALMESYRDSLSGIAHGYAARWLRMLYFSIITITTTGYGDVLPVSDFMRLCVGFEILFGIVLSGGFIWSLTETFKSKPKTDS